MKYIYKRKLWLLTVINVAVFTVLSSKDSRTEDLFKGIKVGASIGMHQGHHTIETDTNIGGSLKDRVTLSGHTPFYGMQFEVLRPVAPDIQAGISIGYGYGARSVQSRLSSTLPDAWFQQYLRQKIETAFIIGSPFGALLPYIKIGAVWGQFQMKTFNGTGHNNKKKFVPGFLAGVGLDFATNSQWFWGGTVQYERYKKMKGAYIRTDGGPSFSGWTVKPSLLSATINVKRRLG